MTSKAWETRRLRYGQSGQPGDARQAGKLAVQTRKMRYGETGHLVAYKTVVKQGGYKRNGLQLHHRVRAQTALGRPLPPNAVVHHVDRDTHNPNARLVLCESSAYHYLLHARERAFNASGHYDWRPCVICGQYDNPTRMVPLKRGFHHRHCRREYERNRKARAAAKLAGAV